ncbi:hypothetical protein ACEPAI_4426 [Sanghuangporus weigelae]
MDLRTLSDSTVSDAERERIVKIREKVLERESLNDWAVPVIEESSSTKSSTIEVNWRTILHTGILTQTNETGRIVVVKEFNRVTASKVTDVPARIEKLHGYYRRECGVWRKIGAHPNIVEILGVMDSYDNSIFPAIVMPYYFRRDIRYFIMENPDTSDKFRAKMMFDVAEGLCYLHKLSPPVIHREIRGSNILVKGENGALTACIADFGSAKFVYDTSYDVSSSTKAGKLDWAAPEQLKEVKNGDSEVTAAADMWSFACTFLEVLTARNPWHPYLHYQRLLSGHYPARPDDIHINDMYWSVMKLCWARLPKDRLSSEDVVMYLRQLKLKQAYH